MVLGATQAVLPAAGVGVCIGALSFHLLSENALRIMIGLIGLGFGMQWWVQHLGFMQSVEQEVPEPGISVVGA